MKTLKITTKLVAFALVLCMASAMFVSCGSNDIVMSMTIEGKTYTIDEDEFSLLMVVEKANLCYQMSVSSSMDTASLWAQKMTDTEETLDAYCSNLIVDRAKSILIEKYLFEKFNLTISDDIIEENEEEEKSKIKEAGGRGAYKQYYGYTSGRYYDVYKMMEARSQAVLEYLMGDNGEMKVVDADLKAYYEENYVGYQYIMLDMENKVVRDEDGNRVRETTTSKDEEGKEVVEETTAYKTEKLTDEEKSEKQNLAETIIAELDAGTATFEEMIEKYSDAYYSVAYPEGLFVVEDDTFMYSEVDKEAKDLEIGEYTNKAISANSGKEQYLVKRVSLKDAVYSDEKYKDLFEGFDTVVEYKKYDTHIKSFYENITVDQAVAGRYSVADTFLSKEVDDKLYYDAYINQLISGSTSGS